MVWLKYNFVWDILFQPYCIHFPLEVGPPTWKKRVGCMFLDFTTSASILARDSYDYLQGDFM